MFYIAWPKPTTFGRHFLMGEGPTGSVLEVGFGSGLGESVLVQEKTIGHEILLETTKMQEVKEDCIEKNK